jgi:hypothetical protein
MMRSPMAMGSPELSNPGTHSSSSSRAGICEVEFHNESLTVTQLIGDRLGIDGDRYAAGRVTQELSERRSGYQGLSDTDAH